MHLPVIQAYIIISYSHLCMHSIFRLNYAAARDGMYPKFIASIHRQYKTPVPALIFHVRSTYTCIAFYNILVN